MKSNEIRLTKEEAEVLRDKAKKLNKNLEQYLKDISLNSKIKIEIIEDTKKHQLI